MERVVVRIGGGPPWGFRLGGGREARSPLRVLKVRRHSRAWRAGLRDGDELVLINGYPCRDTTHAQAGQLMEARASALLLVVSRQARCHTPAEEDKDKVFPLTYCWGKCC
uniref:Synaptopodin 2-like protein n=1 Tax=Petromyzon marinus TaxID=7757 RepID=A0AAJ7TX21_PETMA|nr:synaptopodin 2-like protein [Petromyzon marinus]